MKIYSVEIVTHELNQIRNACISTDALKKEIDRINQCYEFLSEEYKEKYTVLAKKLCDVVQGIYALKEVYLLAAANLDVIEREFIMLRYFQNYQLWQISNKMRYSKTGLFKLKQKAIRHLTEYLSKEEDYD